MHHLALSDKKTIDYTKNGILINIILQHARVFIILTALTGIPL